MVPLAKIKHVIISEGKSESDISLQNDILSAYGGPVTRLPVLSTTKAVKYVIHQNTLNRFLAEQHSEKSFNIGKFTFQDLLNYQDTASLVGIDNIAFYHRECTLSDIHKEMKLLPNFQYYFITTTGDENEKIDGWITNKDIVGFFDI